ncbi:MAG: TonB-dependent receptor, partial [Gemmatimonadetes bacterium]|nr:TonB-dependent receptor [Gemmatimonadota bacterium]
FFPELADQGLGDGRVVGRGGLRAVTGGGTLRAGSFELLLMASDLKKGDPTAPYGASPSETSERNAAGWAGDLRFRRRLGARAEAFSAIRVDAGRLEATYGFAPPAPDHLAEVRGTRITGDLQLRLDASPSSRLVVGAEIRRVRPRMRIGADFGAGPVFPPEIRPSLDMASLFVQHEWQARTDLSVVLGARADRADIGGSALSPRAAVVWHPAPTTALKALYGKAFRAPTPLEQFVDVPGVIVANPDLAPERIRTLELVWEQRLGRHLHGTFSAYDFRMTDLIVQGFDSGVRDLTYQNLGRVHGRGVGAELTGRLGGGRSVFANALLQEAVDQASGESLANSPSLLWRAGAESPLVGGVRLGVVGLYDARRRTLMGATTSANARVNVHLTRALGGPLRASMSVFNLFDARYDHPGGLEHRQQFMPQDGRTLQVQLQARF